MAIATPGRIAEAPRRHIVHLQALRPRPLAVDPIRLRVIAVTPRTRRRLTGVLRRRGRTVDIVGVATVLLLAEVAVTRAEALVVAAVTVEPAVALAAVPRVGIPPEGALAGASSWEQVVEEWRGLSSLEGRDSFVSAFACILDAPLSYRPLYCFGN